MVFGLGSSVLGLWFSLGWSQYHFAVAGGWAAKDLIVKPSCAPTRYREVVLTPSKTKTKGQSPNPIPHIS